MDTILNRLNDYTLLFIENEQGIRENYTDYFKMIFKEVYSASDGEDGYELYKTYKPSLIITDIKMPKLDGISLVKKIRQKDTDTHIVIISAHTDVEFLLQSIPLKLIEYVVKPLSESKLQKVFEKFLSHIGSDKFFYSGEKNEITFDGKTYLLNYKENLFVQKLLFGNRIISYDEIELDLWENKEMSQNALRIFIKNLRKKVPKGFIQNVTNEGYKLGI